MVIEEAFVRAEDEETILQAGMGEKKRKERKGRRRSWEVVTVYIGPNAWKDHSMLRSQHFNDAQTVGRMTGQISFHSFDAIFSIYRQNRTLSVSRVTLILVFQGPPSRLNPKTYLVRVKNRQDHHLLRFTCYWTLSLPSPSQHFGWISVSFINSI